MPEITINDVEVYEPGLLDQENPRSLINICPKALHEYIVLIPRELFLLQDAALTRRAEPDFTDKCLRIQFWQEYVRAQAANTVMKLNFILRGVTHKEYIINLAKTRPDTFAWICVPPKSYDVTQRQIFEEALIRLGESTQISFYDETTIVKEKGGETTTKTSKKLNASAIAELRKTVELLQNRILGSLTSRIQHDHTITPKKEDPPALVDVNSMSKLSADLAKIEAQLDTHDAEFEDTTASDGGEG